MLHGTRARRPYAIGTFLCIGAILAAGCSSGDSNAEAVTKFRDASEQLVTLNDDIQDAASGSGDADLARRTLTRYVPTIRTLAHTLDDLAPKISGKRKDPARKQAAAALALAAAYTSFQSALTIDDTEAMTRASAAVGRAAADIAAATEAWNEAGSS